MRILNKLALSLTLMSSLVMAKSADQCAELKDYIKKNESELYDIYRCETNSDGKIIKLYSGTTITYYKDKLKQETVDKIFSYNTIKTFDFKNNGGFDIKDYYLPFNKLTNLEEISITNGDVGVASDDEDDDRSVEYWSNEKLGKNILKKIPKSVKKLTLNAIDLSQDNINELTTLTQLKELSLENLKLDQSKLNFDGFKKLKNVTKLTVTEERRITDKVYKIIAKFQNLKTLELKSSLSYYSRYYGIGASEILGKLKNLKTIKTNSGRFTEFEDICSLTSVEKVYNKENLVAIDCTSNKN